MGVSIIIGDVRDRLRELPDESVHCVVTSPPYFGLRDYGVAGQIGLEPTPVEFVAVMVDVFRDVRRVLRKDGTCWLNLGDSYAGSWGAQGHRVTDSDDTSWHSSQIKNHPKRGRQTGTIREAGLKAKDLIGIPWRVAFALQADGWYLRQDIIWPKPNPMPESVTDRCTKAHEYLFLLSKSARYHYDAEAIREEAEYGRATNFRTGGHYLNQGQAPDNSGKTGPTTVNKKADLDPDAGRNRRSVWTVATQPFKEAHFATFPPDLIEPCIKAGCPRDCCAKCGAPVVREVEKTRTFESGSGRAGNMPVGKNGANLQGGGETGDIRRGPVVHVETTGWSPSCSCNEGTVRGAVLDPFGGAGTTGLVADRLQRDAILIELNPEYAAIARRRIEGDAPLLTTVAAS